MSTVFEYLFNPEMVSSKRVFFPIRLKTVHVTRLCFITKHLQLDEWL